MAVESDRVALAQLDSAQPGLRVPMATAASLDPRASTSQVGMLPS
jgi:hypothetical protein